MLSRIAINTLSIWYKETEKGTKNAHNLHTYRTGIEEQMRTRVFDESLGQNAEPRHQAPSSHLMVSDFYGPISRIIDADLIGKLNRTAGLIAAAIGS